MKAYLPGIVLFLLCVFLSLITYKDFGMGWDESIQREIGKVSYDYVTTGDHRLDTYENRDYGTGFEIPLLFIEKTLGLEDSRDIYQVRHLACHLFFLAGCLFGYILCYRLFRNNVIACIGFLMFVFHPRILAHSYFNSKDVPFLAMFLVSLAFCQLAFDKRKTYWYILSGIMCGYTASIRIPGIILTCIVTSLLLVDFVYACYKRERAGQQLGRMLAFVAAACLALYIAFPSLWASPVHSFVEIFKSNAHYKWGGTVLFRGQVIPADALPWYYLPVWFCISTPALWLVMGFTGLLIITWKACTHPAQFIQNTRERNFLVYLACFLLPVIMVIVLKSVVYDDWRHVYFIYPSFVLLALYFADKVYKGRWKVTLIAVFAVQFLGIGYFILNNRPNYQVYFNELVPHKPEHLRYNYEMDYWGCSFKRGMEYILANDTSSVVKVYTPVHEILIHNALALMPAEARERVQLEGRQEADYMITNFRMHPEEYDYPVAYEVKVLNSSILKVYRLH